MNTIETLDPNVFKHLVTTIGALPTAFMESMSYYEMIAWLVDYIQKNVITAINDNAEAVQEIQNWINTLDLSSYVGEKIEEMAESGELATVIAQIVDLGTVFGYGTIAEMSVAENLTDGSICRVLGNTTATTGDGAFYKVRELLNTDVIDGVNKVTLTNTDNLIAVRIPDANLNSAVANLQGQIDALHPTKKYLFVGDSYADGYTPDGNVTPWQALLKDMLGLTTEQYVSTHQGGFGFGRAAEYNYYTLINALDNDNNITDIIIGGSYNDQNATDLEILNGITNVRTLCQTKFPNAKLHIAFIGWSKNGEAKRKLITTYHYYKVACDSFKDIDFMQNTQYALHDYFNMFSSDGIHPNLAGETSIAGAIYDCLTKGCANIYFRKPFSFTGTGLSISYGSSNITKTNSVINNDCTTATLDAYTVLTYSEGNYITLQGTNWVEIATITGGVIVGTDNFSTATTVPAVLQLDASTTAPKTGSYSHHVIELAISKGKLYARSATTNTSGNGFGNLVVKQFQIGELTFTINSMFA